MPYVIEKLCPPPESARTLVSSAPSAQSRTGPPKTAGAAPQALRSPLRHGRFPGTGGARHGDAQGAHGVQAGAWPLGTPGRSEVMKDVR